jgi:enoyl-CoA hydratase/carnithine racemase
MDYSNYRHLIIEANDNITTVTLNREHVNAVNEELHDELEASSPLSRLSSSTAPFRHVSGAHAH